MNNKFAFSIIAISIGLTSLLWIVSPRLKPQSTSTVDSLNARIDVMYDSLYYYQSLNDSIAEVNAELIKERDTLRVAIDGTLAAIDGLTKPVVTEKTITEALLWIEKYNDSLLYY